MANNRRKGLDAERLYAKKFRDMGYERCVTSRFGSRQYDNLGVDLIGLPVNIQIKSGKQKNLSLRLCIKDIKGRLKEFGDDKPFALVRRFTGTSGKKLDESDELVVMTFNDFTNLINLAYGKERVLQKRCDKSKQSKTANK